MTTYSQLGTAYKQDHGEKVEKRFNSLSKVTFEPLKRPSEMSSDRVSSAVVSPNHCREVLQPAILRVRPQSTQRGTTHLRPLSIKSKNSKEAIELKEMQDLRQVWASQKRKIAFKIEPQRNDNSIEQLTSLRTAMVITTKLSKEIISSKRKIKRELSRTKTRLVKQGIIAQIPKSY
jgi:hypothetical protein